MTEESLKTLKERYQNILKIKESTQKLEQIKSELLKQKQFLETNPIVAQYLGIIDSIKEVENDISKIDDYYGDDKKILQKTLDNLYISETNGIYVYEGDYRRGDKGLHLSHTYYRPSYRHYIDIEKPYDEGGLSISSRQFVQFELEHVILYPFETTPFLLHQKAQEIFFKTCIESTQEEAIQKVLKLANSKSI